jgi:hypothetical protein
VINTKNSSASSRSTFTEYSSGGMTDVCIPLVVDDCGGLMGYETEISSDEVLQPARW